MTESNDKLVEKVRKLLEKARNVAGTPEADVFNAKAFELIAQYGLDENEVARKGIGKNVDDSKLLAVTFTFDKFAKQRIELLWAIAQPLHCAGILVSSDQGRMTLKLYGVARHVRRVKLLHQFLSAQMLAGASKAVPSNALSHGSAVTEHRESWMKGFADGVMSKVDSVERAAIRQADRNAGDTRVALARESDKDRAWNAMRKAYPQSRSGRGFGTGRGSGYGAGAAAGRQTDVGQTRVGAGGQRSLAG